MQNSFVWVRLHVVSLSLCLLAGLTVYQPICLFISQIFVFLFNCTFTCLSTSPFVSSSACLPICLSRSLLVHLSSFASAYLLVCSTVYQSSCLSIILSAHLYQCQSVCLSSCKFVSPCREYLLKGRLSTVDLLINTGCYVKIHILCQSEKQLI